MKAQEDCLSWDDLSVQLNTLKKAAQAGDVYAMKAVLTVCVQGYGPAMVRSEWVVE
jgi:hypothetical protein